MIKQKHYMNRLKIKYQSYSTTNSTSTTQSFISEVYNLTKSVSEALKNAQNTIDFVRQQRTTTSGDSAAASLATWSATINSDSTNLLSSINTIKSSTQSVLQKKVDLLSVQDGADELDIASQLLTLKQKEYDYQNYFIRAPFDGLLAKLSVKSTDRVNSGTSIATLVSHQKIATISLNEVDAVNVKVGQKAQITFDAIEGLKIEGTVVSVESSWNCFFRNRVL
jgi:multidrug resistance efflux pump